LLKLENYIGGELVQPASGEYLDNYRSVDWAVYSSSQIPIDRDVHLAVEAASAAFPAWSIHRHLRTGLTSDAPCRL
jgi:aminomuconate-semialdehyde/2-hydroxymuconate-6-semialdehyde dehydrogenase